MSALLWRLSARSARHLSCILCHAWPIVQSFKAAESTSASLQCKWATFWLVHSPLWIAESLPWFRGMQRMPGYWHARLLAMLWLTSKRTEGARWIWEVAFRPWLVRHESSIDRRLDELASKSAAWAAVGKAKGTETLRRGIMMACMQLSAIVSRSLQASQKARARLSGAFTQNAATLTLLPVTPAASPRTAAESIAAATSVSAVAPTSLAVAAPAPIAEISAVRSAAAPTPASLLFSLRTTVDEQWSQVVQEQLPVLQAAAGEFVHQQLSASLRIADAEQLPSLQPAASAFVQEHLSVSVCMQSADEETEQDENEAINFKRYCSPSPPPQPLRKSRNAASANAAAAAAAAAGEPATLPPPLSAAKASPLSSPPRQKLSHVNPRKNKTLQPLFDEMD